MDNISILLLMILGHIIDDFVLQGKLAEMKQRKFWETYGAKYEYDYVICLFIHGFEWVIVVSLPIIFLGLMTPGYLALMICMAVVHAVVDDAKANQFEINLIQDQLIHFLQVVLLWSFVLVAPAW